LTLCSNEVKVSARPAPRRRRCRQIAGLAERYGTPLFLYDAEKMRDAARALKQRPRRRLSSLCRESNPAPGVIRLFAALGLGAEVASGGELQLALGCGIAPDRIVFSGPAKTDLELALQRRPAFSRSRQNRGRNSKRCRRSVKRSVCLPALRYASIWVDPVMVSAEAAGPEVSPFGLDDEALAYVAAHAVRLDRVRIVGVHNHQSSQTPAAERLVERFRRFCQDRSRAQCAVRPRIRQFWRWFRRTILCR